MQFCVSRNKIHIHTVFQAVFSCLLVGMGCIMVYLRRAGRGQTQSWHPLVVAVEMIHVMSHKCDPGARQPTLLIHSLMLGTPSLPETDHLLPSIIPLPPRVCPLPHPPFTQFIPSLLHIFFPLLSSPSPPSHRPLCPSPLPSFSCYWLPCFMSVQFASSC